MAIIEPLRALRPGQGSICSMPAIRNKLQSMSRVFWQIKAAVFFLVYCSGVSASLLDDFIGSKVSDPFDFF